MLPYTPLHHLLFARGEDPEILVMTSGNRSGGPIVADDEEAVAVLGPVVDAILCHGRPIANACEDSVARVTGGGIRLLRRSRGYAPEGFPVPTAGTALVAFGFGGEDKNAFTFLRQGRAFPGPHLGRMDSTEGLARHERARENMAAFWNCGIDAVGYDPHPGYRSSLAAKAMTAGRHYAVQHHHAHIASCMAENGLTGEVIGLVLDGTGYGPDDGRIWGFEAMAAGYLDYRRCVHLAYVPLAGGEAAVRHPWRSAISHLYRFLGPSGLALAVRRFPGQARAITAIWKTIAFGLNAPLVSSAGRLFDAFAALIGVCSENTYDGQAPAELEEAARRAPDRPEPYPFSIARGEIGLSSFWRAVAADLEKPAANAAVLARRFHETVAAMAVGAAMAAQRRTGIDRVVLSGGVMQNTLLSELIGRRLSDLGFSVYQHRLVPANDGGLSLGQAAVAHWRLMRDVSGTADENPGTP